MAGIGRHLAPWWVERVSLRTAIPPDQCAHLLAERIGSALPVTIRGPAGGAQARDLRGEVVGNRFSLRTTFWKRSVWTRQNDLRTELAGTLVDEPSGGTRIECAARLHRFYAIVYGIVAALWIVGLLQIPFYLVFADLPDDTRVFMLLAPLAFLLVVAAFAAGRWYALEERDALLALLRELLAAS